MAKAVLMQAVEPDQSEAHGDQYGEEVAELCALLKQVEGTFSAVTCLPCELLPEKLVCCHFPLII